MLNRIEGVSKSVTLPKKGGEAKKTSGEEPKNIVDDSSEFKHKPQSKTKYHKGNEASGSKGKGKWLMTMMKKKKIY